MAPFPRQIAADAPKAFVVATRRRRQRETPVACVDKDDKPNRAVLSEAKPVVAMAHGECASRVPTAAGAAWHG